jgi:hypothetical protein
MRANQGCGEIWGSKSESIRLRPVRNRIVAWERAGHDGQWVVGLLHQAVVARPIVMILSVCHGLVVVWLEARR